ncbi:hypothetical protein Bbelb_302940 [Branchiostoma belcheri]|nr:hypothetical protein Bbelb_302940 [Branchiostoma belcheri]
MSRRRRGRSRPYCIVLTGSSTDLEVEQERDLTITGTTSLDRAFSESPSAEHGSMPANLNGRYGGVKNSEWSLPLGQQLPRRPSLDERHTRTLGIFCYGIQATDGPRDTSRLYASAKRKKIGPRSFQLAAIRGPDVRRCQTLVTSSLATGEIVGRARHSYRWRRRPDFMRLADAPGREIDTSRLYASAKRKKIGPRSFQLAAIRGPDVRRCQTLVTSSLATGEIVGRARHSYRWRRRPDFMRLADAPGREIDTSRLYASAKRKKIGPRSFQLAAIRGPDVRRCQTLVTSSLATGETVGRARHSYRWRRRPDFMRLADAPGREIDTSRLYASAKRKKIGPRSFQLAAIRGPDVRRCQTLVTSSLATGETVGRARHSYRWRRRPDFMRLADAPGREIDTSRLYASAKRKKIGPRSFQLAAIRGPDVRRCQTLVTSSLATGEIVGRARHSYRWRRRPDFMRLADAPGREIDTSRLYASAKRKKIGPRSFQLAAIRGPDVRRCQTLVTSSLATGETVGRARHSYRWRRRPDFMRLADAPGREIDTSRLYASAKRKKIGPRSFQLAAIRGPDVRRCQTLVTSSLATGEIVGRARHSYRWRRRPDFMRLADAPGREIDTSRLYASAKRKKIGPRSFQLAAIRGPDVRRCQTLVTSSLATGEIVGRARHSYRWRRRPDFMRLADAPGREIDTSRLYASAKRKKIGPRSFQLAAIRGPDVRRCQTLVTSSLATGEIVGRARHSYRWRRRPDFMRLADAPGREIDTSRLYASAKRKKIGPRSFQLAAIRGPDVRRCQTLVTSSLATGEIVGRARHSYRWRRRPDFMRLADAPGREIDTSRLYASAKRKKNGPRSFQLAAIRGPDVRRCQTLVTSSLATGETVGRARHSYRWRRRPDFMRLADAPGREIDTSRLYASAKRKKIGPRSFQLAAIRGPDVRRCQTLVTSSLATGEIVGRARHSYRWRRRPDFMRLADAPGREIDTSRLYASAKRKKIGPRSFKLAAIRGPDVRRCQTLVTSSLATGEIVGRARHSYRWRRRPDFMRLADAPGREIDTSRLYASAKRKKIGPRSFQLAAIRGPDVRRCQTLVTSSLATGEIVGRARHSYRWRRRPDFMRLADAPGREIDTSRLYASAKRKKIGPRSFQLAAIRGPDVRRCQTLVTSSLATGETVGRARHSYRWRRRPDFMRLADAPGREIDTSRLYASAKRKKIGPRSFQLAAIRGPDVRRCQTLVTSSLATGEIVGRARHSYRWRRRPDFMRLADAPGREIDTSRLYASAKRKKIGPRSFQLAAIRGPDVRRCQTLVTSSLATGEIVGRARHSYRWRRRPDFMRLADAPGREIDTSRLYASAKRKKIGPRSFQLAAIRGPDVRRCQTLVTSSLATGETVGRARHSYRWRRRPDFMRLADAPGREIDTSRLYASAKRKKIGPRSFQLAAIRGPDVRRCQTLVTSSLATGEIVGRARHSYRWRRRPDFMRLADAPGREIDTSRLYASAKRKKIGPRSFQLAAIRGPDVRRCQTLVTSSLATGETVGRARHSYRWRRRPDFMRLADAPGREIDTSRLYASAKRKKIGPRSFQLAAIRGPDVRRCQTLVTSSLATGEIVGRARHSYRWRRRPDFMRLADAPGREIDTSRLYASAKRKKIGPRSFQLAAIRGPDVRRCQTLVTSSLATGEIVGRARHSYRWRRRPDFMRLADAPGREIDTSRLYASAKRKKIGPRSFQLAAIRGPDVRRCQTLVTSSLATGEIVGRARHSYRWRRRPDFMRLADAPGREIPRREGLQIHPYEAAERKLGQTGGLHLARKDTRK